MTAYEKLAEMQIARAKSHQDALSIYERAEAHLQMDFESICKKAQDDNGSHDPKLLLEAMDIMEQRWAKQLQEEEELLSLHPL